MTPESRSKRAGTARPFGTSSRPLEATRWPCGAGPPNEKELRARPEWAGASRIFRKSELVEFSVVNVPANPDALVTAIRKGNLSLSAATLKHFFGVEPTAVEPQPIRDIKRVVTITRVPMIRRVPIIRPVTITNEQVKAIAQRTVQTARGRMVPV